MNGSKWKSIETITTKLLNENPIGLRGKHYSTRVHKQTHSFFFESGNVFDDMEFVLIELFGGGDDDDEATAKKNHSTRKRKRGLCPFVNWHKYKSTD